ncbi:hypothetical protein ACHAXS_005196, partial [Conticribra weissflogii]
SNSSQNDDPSTGSNSISSKSNSNSNSNSNSKSNSHPSRSQLPLATSSQQSLSSSSATLQQNYAAAASSLTFSTQIKTPHSVGSSHNNGGGIPGFHGIGNGFARKNSYITASSSSSAGANRISCQSQNFSGMTSSSSFHPHQNTSTAQNNQNRNPNKTKSNNINVPSSNQNQTDIMLSTNHRRGTTAAAVVGNQNRTHILLQSQLQTQISQLQPNQLQHQTHHSIAGLPTSLGPINLNIPAGGTVPEFLYQLTKMLTDTHNSPIIEWSPLNNGRIEVHNPTRLAAEVLHKYFRHSKYSSFQRQLNYFGFRKIAGKGKMSPCSYVNDAATSDIRSLLLIKRKTSEKERMRLEKLQLQRLEKRGSVGATGIGGAGDTGSSADGSAADSDMREIGNGGNGNQKAKSATGQADANVVAMAGHGITALAASSSSALLSTPSAGPSHACNTVTPLSPNSAKLHISAVNVNNPILSTGKNNISEGNSDLGSNKRIKTEQNNTRTGTPGITNATFTVAIGKGVRHPWNGYLRDNNPNINNYNNHNNSFTNNNQNKTLPANSAIAKTLSMPASALPLPAPMPAMYNNIFTSRNITNQMNKNETGTIQDGNRNNAKGLNQYLSHPSSNYATTAPAPLQFLDPSELGMNIESSLNQLKNNFRNATKSYADSQAAAAPTVARYFDSKQKPTSNSANAGNNASSIDSNSSAATTSRNTNEAETSCNNKEEEIVDPLNELESADNVASSAAAASMNNMNGNNSDMKKVISMNSFAGGFLSRNSSLIDLAMLPTLDDFDTEMGLASIDNDNFNSAVDGTGNVTSADGGDAKVRGRSGGAGTVGDSQGLDKDEDGTFHFIDFPNGDQETGYGDIL